SAHELDRSVKGILLFFFRCVKRQPLGGRLDDLTSWRRGLLVFDEQPLGEVVVRLNRYRPGHLLVAPGALAQRRGSGGFRGADLEASLQSISDELGVRSLGLAGVTLLY
ncbi:hypothetical protein AAER79_31025, partial [Klebsiella pneumoniae]